MDVSIVTSMYRTDAHLPGWIKHFRKTAAEVHAAGVQLEAVLVCNDATPLERQLLDELAANPGTAAIRLLYVDRETIYASWNRGVREASADVIGFWNVDDTRYADAIVEGVRHINEDGCKLVYFGWYMHDTLKWLGIVPVGRAVYYPAQPFDLGPFTKFMLTGPHFMFHRDLYNEIGPFDERFRIGGDYEWSIRAAKKHELCPVDIPSGHFFDLGTNLSTGGWNVKFEDNIVNLIHGNDDRLLNTDPVKMREILDRWGDDIQLTPEQEERLFGEGAAERWQTWLRQRDRAMRRFFFAHAWRLPLRLFIDQTGLRELLYRLGIAKSQHTTTYLRWRGE